MTAAPVDLTIPATTMAPSQARAALGELADDLSDEILEPARLLVSELVSNSVRHGATGPDSRVRVRAEIVPRGLRIEVSDWGVGFSPAVGRLRDDGGFGLLLVARLATRWGIDCQGITRVWFEIVR